MDTLLSYEKNDGYRNEPQMKDRFLIFNDFITRPSSFSYHQINSYKNYQRKLFRL